jgi:hypothetical protein
MHVTEHIKCRHWDKRFGYCELAKYPPTRVMPLRDALRQFKNEHGYPPYVVLDGPGGVALGPVLECEKEK